MRRLSLTTNIWPQVSALVTLDEVVRTLEVVVVDVSVEDDGTN
jgi:hypothetical protein